MIIGARERATHRGVVWVKEVFVKNKACELASLGHSRILKADRCGLRSYYLSDVGHSTPELSAITAGTSNRLEEMITKKERRKELRRRSGPRNADC